MGRYQPTRGSPADNTPTKSYGLVRILALWRHIDPYFFENDVGDAITINGERYRTMIIDFFFLSKLNDEDVDDMWFQ